MSFWKFSVATGVSHWSPLFFSRLSTDWWWSCRSKWNTDRSLWTLGSVAMPWCWQVWASSWQLPPHPYHLDAVFADVISKEVHWGLMDRALFSFKEQFSQVFQDLHNLLAIFSHAPGVDKDNINVDKHKPMEELPRWLHEEVLRQLGWGYEGKRGLRRHNDSVE